MSRDNAGVNPKGQIQQKYIELRNMDVSLRLATRISLQMLKDEQAAPIDSTSYVLL